jgi:uncharacterized protein (DUF488 family)
MSVATIPTKVRSIATTFFTIGYEQSEPQEFLRRLQSSGVELVVDVRDVPLSRKRGFSKNQLQALLAEKDIEYLHIKPLGAPKEIRDPLRSGGSWWEYVKGYKAVLRARQGEVKHLSRLAAKKRICLLCFERNPAECHRSLIARELETQAQEIMLQVEHIRY